MYTGHSFPNESRIGRVIGEDVLDKLKAASDGVFCPVPVAGTDVFTYDGMLVPRMRGGGFSSLSDLISEATTGGKRQDRQFGKTGVTGAVGRANTLWTTAGNPPSGGVSPALPGGAVPTRLTTGAIKQLNPTGGDTLHITTVQAMANIAGQLLLIYDRLWHATWNHATASQAVTSTADRYQTATSAPGNFLSMEVTTVLGAGTPTVAIEYTNADGTALQASTSAALTTAAAVATVPYAAPDWSQPLAAGDVGIRNLTGNIVLSGANSGIVNLFLGHPLCWVPMGAAFTPVVMDGINSAFNLVEVKTDACIGLMEVGKSVATATSWWGNMTMVSG